MIGRYGSSVMMYVSAAHPRLDGGRCTTRCQQSESGGRRPAMNSSIGIAGKVMIRTEPREARTAETRAMVKLSGASTTLTKSYGPRTAHWLTTWTPILSSSSLTARIRSGSSLTVWAPSSVRVLSRIKVAMVLGLSGKIDCHWDADAHHLVFARCSTLPVSWAEDSFQRGSPNLNLW